jgi:hypothetical protein
MKRPSSAATTTSTMVTAVEVPAGRAGGRWELERRWFTDAPSSAAPSDAAVPRHHHSLPDDQG